MQNSREQIAEYTDDDCSRGSSLSEAMQADATIYDELTVQMVKVGENAGKHRLNGCIA